jgi:hypothetical protein
MPDVPSPDAPQGVVPRIISTLVARRREVKGLMKGKGTTEVQMMQVRPPVPFHFLFKLVSSRSNELDRASFPSFRLAVQYPTARPQADRQLDVRLSWIRVLSVLRPSSRRSDDLQRTRDPYLDQGARRVRQSRGMVSFTSLLLSGQALFPPAER